MANNVNEASTQQPKTPKIWNIEDHEFVYAPPKPEGDPWTALIASRREKDKVKCDGWKEEVQNLLIFAGLFSAVVTAFVIESYKTLQPDPNLAIIGLLSHMATRLDNPLNETATESTPIANQAFATFTPTPSAIRINIFWFLSLILSLTTVLVGIVTLQWLREYQSYPSLTPKETCAIFQMRSEGMKKWYVWEIFTALPLLLQAALVLFFAGVIDFLLTLENRVAIPVALVGGVTILFLVATTVLPTFQGLLLYFPFLFSRDLSKAPSQCAYKSPQSHAFRRFFSFSFTLAHHIFRAVRPICQYLGSIIPPIYQYLGSVIRPIFRKLRSVGLAIVQHLFSSCHFFSMLLHSMISAILCLGQHFVRLLVVNAATNVLHENAGPENGELDTETKHIELKEGAKDVEHHVTPQILWIWKTKNWREFDSGWIRLRDACVHGIKDDRPGLAQHRRFCGIFPLFDSVQAILEAAADTRATDSFQLSAIYHSFSDLSQSVTEARPDYPYSEKDFIHRRNRYFHSLWKWAFPTSYEPEYKFIENSSGDRWIAQDYIRLHHQNSFLFIFDNLRQILWGSGGLPQILSSHFAELQILAGTYWGGHHILLSPWTPDLPGYLSFQTCTVLEIAKNKTLCWQYSYILKSFFEYAATKDLETSQGSLHSHPGVLDFLQSAAQITLLVTRIGQTDPAAKDRIDLLDAYKAILVYIGAQLDQSLSTMPIQSNDMVWPEMSYFFYTSAIYIQNLVRMKSLSAPNLLNDNILLVLASMCSYQEQTGVVNEFIEAQFKGTERLPPYYERFTKEWWSFLDYGTPSAGLESQAGSPSESLSHLDPEPLSGTHSGGLDTSNNIANQVIDPSNANDAVISIEYPKSQTQSQSQSQFEF